MSVLLQGLACSNHLGAVWPTKKLGDGPCGVLMKFVGASPCVTKRCALETSQDTEACRFHAVCARCSTECKGVSNGVVVGDPAAVPVCDEVPTGANSATTGGTTLETLELEPGFFRTSNTSHTVRECFQESACKGGTDASDDGYCAAGYEGPCKR